MEGQGPEVKRSRLATYDDGSYRRQQQPPIATHPSLLRNHDVASPPSRYYAHDYNQAHPRAGRNTPSYTPKPTDSRCGDASVVTRSSNDYQQYSNGQPLNIDGISDRHYPLVRFDNVAGLVVGISALDALDDLSDYAHRVAPEHLEHSQSSHSTAHHAYVEESYGLRSNNQTMLNPEKGNCAILI